MKLETKGGEAVRVYRDAFGALHVWASEQRQAVSLADCRGALGQVGSIMKDLNGTPDEHGAWMTGIESDKKQRGTAVNVDLYGVATWRHRVYGVVQVRQAEFRPNRYTKVRKDYYLIGRNENGRPFAHPVSWAPIRAAVRRDPEDLAAPVLAAMAWIWGVTPAQLRAIERNGDTALIPVKRLPEDAECFGAMTARVIDSHVVRARELYTDGTTVYVRDAELSHQKGQHPAVRCESWARVAVARREPTWGFTAPTAD